MRVLLTAVAGGAATDLAVHCEDDATVADLAAEIASRLPAHEPTVTHPVAGSPLGVVGTRAVETPPALYVGQQPLEPARPVAESPIRHGVLLGVGAPAPDAMAEPAGTLELRIVGGPGAGRVRRLLPGRYVLGSGEDSALPLPDPTLPPQVATLEIDATGRVTLTPDPAVVGLTRPAPLKQGTPGPIVVPHRQDAPPRRRRRGLRRREALPAELHDDIDPRADVPVLHLERRPVDAAVPWQPGEALAAGTLLLELAEVTVPDASLSLNPAGATLDYNRPPRLLPPDPQDGLQPPQRAQAAGQAAVPPGDDPRADRPGRGLLDFVTRSAYSLIFMGMSPLMALGNYTSGSRQGRKRYDQGDHSGLTRAPYGEDPERRAGRSRRGAHGPGAATSRNPAEVLITAVGPRARLWERRQTDPDFLVARVGTADNSTPRSPCRTPNRESHEGVLAWTAPDVPVTVPLSEVGVTGIAGTDAERRGLARWILAQTAVLHTPADVDMVLLAGAETEAQTGTGCAGCPTCARRVGGQVAQVGADEAFAAPAGSRS